MRAAAAQIAFRYRPQDSATGVTRTTTKRLADVLGVDETQVIHMALHSLATKFLPQYEADEGALTKAQLNQVKKSAPKAKGGTVRSSLFDLHALVGAGVPRDTAATAANREVKNAGGENEKFGGCRRRADT